MSVEIRNKCEVGLLAQCRHLPVPQPDDKHPVQTTAFFYYAGLGVPQSYGEALKWNGLAAAQGIAMAQYNLAQQLAGGEGTPADFVAAHMWANISTMRWGSMPGISPEKQREGAELARALRERLSRRMNPAQIAEAQRLAREWDEAHPRD